MGNKAVMIMSAPMASFRRKPESTSIFVRGDVQMDPGFRRDDGIIIVDLGFISLAAIPCCARASAGARHKARRPVGLAALRAVCSFYVNAIAYRIAPGRAQAAWYSSAIASIASES